MRVSNDSVAKCCSNCNATVGNTGPVMLSDLVKKQSAIIPHLGGAHCVARVGVLMVRYKMDCGINDKFSYLFHMVQ